MIRATLGLFVFLLCASSSAKPLANVRPANAPVSRVVRVETLVDEVGKVRVAFVLVDLGGSTDVSPTQKVFFTLYQKGEMFSVDAAFDLGPVGSFKSAKRSGAGKYEAVVEVVTDRGEIKPATFTVDAGAAILAIKSLKCSDETACPEAEKFTTKVDFVTKTK